MASKSCSNCGTDNHLKAKFCTGCGAIVENTSNQSYSSGQSNSTQSNSCLWCGKSQGFKEEEGKLDSKWGVTAHKMKIFICNACGYVHLFGLGRSIWDFD